MAIVLDGKPIETKYELLSDGREIVASEQGRRVVSSLRWDGDALVGTWRVEIPNSEMTIFLSVRTGRWRAPSSSLGTASRR
jgi:hypothetical protein